MSSPADLPPAPEPRLRMGRRLLAVAAVVGVVTGSLGCWFAVGEWKDARSAARQAALAQATSAAAG